MEMSVPGERGILVPRAEEEIRAEVGDGLAMIPEGLKRKTQPDWEGLVANIRREGTPKRVHDLELFHDSEVEDAIIERFGLDANLDPNNPDSVNDDGTRASLDYSGWQVKVGVRWILGDEDHEGQKVR